MTLGLASALLIGIVVVGFIIDAVLRTKERKRAQKALYDRTTHDSSRGYDPWDSQH